MILLVAILFSMVMVLLLVLVPFVIYKVTSKENLAPPKTYAELEMSEKTTPLTFCLVNVALLLACGGLSYYTVEIGLSTLASVLNPNDEPNIKLIMVLTLLYAGVGYLVYGAFGHIKLSKTKPNLLKKAKP